MWCSTSRGAAQEARRIANAPMRTKRAAISILPREFLATIKSKEFLCSCGGCASDFFQRNSAGPRDFLRDESRVSGLATFSAKRNGREIRAGGFDHERIERNFRGDFAHLFSVLERDNSGERHEVAEIENFVRLFERTAEAMKHAAELSPVVAQNFERIVPRVALMNDHVHSQLDCEIQ